MSLLEQAQADIKVGRWTQAVLALQEHLQSFPDDGLALRCLTQAYSATRNLVAAEHCARRLTSLEPDDARHWHVCGCLLRRQGRLDEARAAQGKALELRPTWDKALQELSALEAARPEGPPEMGSCPCCGATDLGVGTQCRFCGYQLSPQAPTPAETRPAPQVPTQPVPQEVRRPPPPPSPPPAVPTCPSCRGEVFPQAERCPNCGRALSGGGKFLSDLGWIAAGAAVIALMGGIFGAVLVLVTADGYPHYALNMALLCVWGVPLVCWFIPYCLRWVTLRNPGWRTFCLSLLTVATVGVVLTFPGDYAIVKTLLVLLIAWMSTSEIVSVWRKVCVGSSWTSLHFAALAGWTAYAAWLLERGADVNAKDRDGVTPLREASRRGHTATAELLRRYGGHE